MDDELTALARDRIAAHDQRMAEIAAESAQAAALETDRQAAAARALADAMLPSVPTPSVLAAVPDLPMGDPPAVGDPVEVKAADLPPVLAPTPTVPAPEPKPGLIWPSELVIDQHDIHPADQHRPHPWATIASAIFLLLVAVALALVLILR